MSQRTYDAGVGGGEAVAKKETKSVSGQSSEPDRGRAKGTGQATAARGTVPGPRSEVPSALPSPGLTRLHRTGRI